MLKRIARCNTLRSLRPLKGAGLAGCMCWHVNCSSFIVRWKKNREREVVRMSQEKIVIWWDDDEGIEGWHVDLLRSNGLAGYDPVLTSGCSGFPVSVEQFGPLEEDLLIQALKGAFPDADISLKF
ncbi:MAG: hypothetical protein HGB01_09550 [Chlorobiaceae bacterium]|nr:hypothetical protein [Chlorobiaceae bacterium]